MVSRYPIPQLTCESIAAFELLTGPHLPIYLAFRAFLQLTTVAWSGEFLSKVTGVKMWVRSRKSRSLTCLLPFAVHSATRMQITDKRLKLVIDLVPPFLTAGDRSCRDRCGAARPQIRS